MKNILIYKFNDRVHITHFKDDVDISTAHEHAKKIVPEGTPYRVSTTDELPTSRAFRNAWNDGGSCININLDGAKQITHQARRRARAHEFGPHDEVVMKQIPGVDTDAAEQARAEIRARYADMQITIDACDCTQQLEEILHQCHRACAEH